jgi:VWFA-related protein
MMSGWPSGIGLSLLAATAFGSDEPPRFQASVSAERVVVEARVIDNAGHPVAGLSATDFDIRVDGRRAEVEEAEWIAAESSPDPALAAEPESDEPPAETDGPAPRLPKGRLLVLFFQTDYDFARITGQMRMIREALRFLDSCPPEDFFAVLSFDSHLKLRQDFTRDRAAVRHAIGRTLYMDRNEDPRAGEAPSIAASMDFHAARRASLPEHALRVLGDALQPIPGPKSLLFFGWGIGDFDPYFGAILGHTYGAALRALLDSHTAVFSLDVTTADSHSLEGTLEALAGDTGGFYVKTHRLPRLAMDKVANAIAGYYLLTFRTPEGLPRGGHRLSVRIGRRDVSVLARSGYRD